MTYRQTVIRQINESHLNQSYFQISFKSCFNLLCYTLRNTSSNANVIKSTPAEAIFISAYTFDPSCFKRQHCKKGLEMGPDPAQPEHTFDPQ